MKYLKHFKENNEYFVKVDNFDSGDCISISNQSIDYIKQFFADVEAQFNVFQVACPTETNPKSTFSILEIFIEDESYDRSSDESDIDIWEYPDEYFFVIFNKSNLTYKCDQLDGVKELLMYFNFISPS